MTHPASIASAGFLRARVGRLCVAIEASSAAEMVSLAEAALAESSFLEFRLDSLADPAASIPALGRFLNRQRAHRGEVAAIATCRRKAFGGAFAGSLDRELAVLTAAAEAGFSLIDLEVESAEALGAKKFTALKEQWRDLGAALLVSFHDFAGPGDPETAYQRIKGFAPEFIKIVNTARSLMDSQRLLAWLASRSDDGQLVAIAMGEQGVLSRILGLRSGGAFTFAAAPTGRETAAGQMTARLLRELYAIDELDQGTRVYGVAGNPVSHSMSPLMHNTAFRRERMNAVYLPLKTERVEDLFELFHSLPLSGASVTMPHKQAVIAHLANVDPLTERMKACNTIRLGADGRLYGFNTDVAGIVRPLEKRINLRGARILVLGAGGASRAAVFGLAEKGAEVMVWSRTESKARALAKEAGVTAIARDKIRQTPLDVLINGTPCGMTGNDEPLPLAHNEWQAKLVFDLVYNPLETPLLKEARRRGAGVILGVEMFVQQGVRQFELWTGKPAPEGEMQRAVHFALQQAQARRS